MKIVVLDAGTLGDDVELDAIKRFGEVSVYETTACEELLKRAAGAEVIITNKVAIDARALDELSSLKLICVAATGFNVIDVAACKKMGVAVANVAGYSTQSVVQTTFGMLFYMMQHLSYYDSFVKSGRYTKSNTFNHLGMPFNELCGKKYGVIGLGAIGAKVASVAREFGCDVSYYSTSGKNVNEKYKSVSLEELLKNSDIVSIHCPLNDRTKNMIDYDKLKLMKKSAILLNLARGGIVCEASLAKAIDEGVIAGAGFDVYSKEPATADNPLLNVKNFDRIMLTPHIAWTSVESRRRLVAEMAENIGAFLNGERRNRVD